MKIGDIIICSNTTNDYYATRLVVGNKYEILSSNALMGADGFDKPYMDIRCLETQKIIHFMPCYLFITLERYRDFKLRQLNI